LFIDQATPPEAFQAMLGVVSEVVPSDEMDGLWEQIVELRIDRSVDGRFLDILHPNGYIPIHAIRGIPLRGISQRWMMVRI